MPFRFAAAKLTMLRNNRKKTLTFKLLIHRKFAKERFTPAKRHSVSQKMSFISTDV